MKLLNALAIGALSLTLAGAAQANEHQGGPPSHHGHMMQKMDTNRDGAVSKAEFRAKGDKMFAKLDADKNGRVTQDEFRAAKERHREHRQKHWDKKGACENRSKAGSFNS